MERRFNIRDLFLYGFLTLLLIMIILAMYMVDRQWEKMAQMQQLMVEQADDLRELRTLTHAIDQPVRGTVPADQTATTSGAELEIVPAAFLRAYKASRQKDYQSGDWLVE